VLETLTQLAFPFSNNLEFFAFFSKEKNLIDSWELYNPSTELSRIISPVTSTWRVTSLNQNHELCNTYPSVFGVPEKADDPILENAARFRTKNRLPALSWVHPKTKASITRCSQPKVGPWRRNEHDEFLIRAIREATPSGAKLFILDARPRATAVANQAKGAGYESTEVYEHTELLFMNIPNIHTIRDSFKKVKECCFPSPEESHFFAKLEETRWPEFIKLILQTSVKIVELVDRQGASVLVHCSDGWDRTPQLTALAMLMMDPFYRTIKGFCILVEKEWISFGHKFMQRLGYGSKEYNDDQRAPIFLQFLDCVFQLLHQFPCSFQFTPNLLVFIADEMYSCRFGNFLYNSDKERADKKVMERTQSIWYFVTENETSFTNPLYIESEEEKERVLYPSTTSRMIRLWSDYFLRWSPQSRKSEVAVERQKELRLMVEDLKNKIDDLENQLENTQES